MEEPFKPLSLSIKELFCNADSLYKIPQYQRPYKWENEQINKLWEDLYDAYENDEENYFLGSIITAKPRDDERSAYVDVVDGQQRLTTLMILFCVIRDLYPELNENKDIENPMVVGIDTINSSISLYGKSKRLRLNTHSQHQSAFDELIINGNTRVIKPPYKFQVRMDEEPQFKFMNTAVTFRNNLEQLKDDDVEKFINFIFNDVKIIRIDCKNREFAIKLFQVLNARGMDLTAADLIKSYLLEKLYTRYSGDKENSKLKEDQFISDWREMEQWIKTCDISLNDLFILYEYHLLGQNPKKSLYDELQDAFKDSDPNIVISSIKQFSNYYYREIYEKEDKVLYSFRYIRWNMYWKSILTTAVHTGYRDYEKLTIELTRFYYLYWIAGKTLSQIKQTSFNLIKWIKEEKPINEIADELNKKLDSDGIIDLAKRNLASKQVASEYWIKPLLILIEYNLTDNSNPSFIELKSDLHLEHILPKRYSTFEEWGHISSEVGDKWINSVGNLTLLSGAKNIEASNNPFSQKMGIYNGKGKYDDKNDKISAFKITQIVMEDYNNGTYNRQWNKEAIIARWKWFFKELGEILDVDFSDEINRHEPELI